MLAGAELGNSNLYYNVLSKDRMQWQRKCLLQNISIDAPLRFSYTPPFYQVGTVFLREACGALPVLLNFLPI